MSPAVTTNGSDIGEGILAAKVILFIASKKSVQVCVGEKKPQACSPNGV